MPALTPGDRIGRYRLVRQLGSGAMGEVWQADLQGPGGFVKPVALKLLRSSPDRVRDGSALLREAKRGARLHHPNVVGVHAVETHGGSWVVVMELVEGAPLSELLRHGGPLPPLAVLEVGVQAAAGLQHIHALRESGAPAGLVHRDIKLSNLLLDRTGLVKVADLGVAAVAGSGSAAGTPGYMAPELLDGHADARSDLFSLGATLFVCATGRRPFGRGRSALVSARRGLSSAQLAQVDAAVAGLADVLRRCLDPDPNRRHASAADLGAALSTLRARQPTSPTLLDVLTGLRPELEVTASSSPTSETQPKTVVLSRDNLPTRLDTFFGRAERVQDLVARLQGGEQLVTLLGPGGMGKTRLALQAGSALKRTLVGGAWFFDLSEARTADGICFEVGRTLGLPLDTGDPVDAIGWALQNRSGALFIFDNLEQCVGALPQTLGRWLEVAGQGRFLCTSRVRLELRGELVVPLGSLPTADAVALFVERAPVALADQLDEVAAVVEQVEGIPLAIELAAARTALVPLAQLRDRLGLRLLGGGGRQLPARHRSIRACLAWSWDLLEGPLQRAMAQLSVFEGGFDLAAAEAVIDLDDDVGWALDVLEALVGASLVRADPGTGRFSMFVVVSEFASEQLRDPLPAQARHGAWFAQQRSRAVLDDLDNLVVGSRRAVARGDATAAVGCALGAWQILEQRGPMSIGVDLLQSVASRTEQREPALTEALVEALTAVGRTEEALPIASEGLQEALQASDDEARASMSLLLGGLHMSLGMTDQAGEHLDAAHALFVALGDRRREGIALLAVGQRHKHMGRVAEARACYEQALELQRALGARQQQGVVLSNLADLHREAGSLDAAYPFYTQALSLHAELGDRRAEARTLGNLGIWAARQGTDDALPYLEAALAAHRELGSRRSQGIVLCNLGGLHLGRADMDAARRCFDASLAIHRETGNRRGEGIVLGNLGDLHHQLGRLEDAMSCYRAALTIHREVGNRRSEGVTLGTMGTTLEQLGQHQAARAHIEQALAMHRELGNQVHQAIMLAELGQLYLHSDLVTARAHLQAAEGLARTVGDPLVLGSICTVVADLERRSGDLDAARRVLDDAEEVLAGQHAQESLGELLCLRALVAVDAQDGHEARSHLAEAEAILDALGLPASGALGQRLRETQLQVDAGGQGHEAS